MKLASVWGFGFLVMVELVWLLTGLLDDKANNLTLGVAFIVASSVAFGAAFGKASDLSGIMLGVVFSGICGAATVVSNLTGNETDNMEFIVAFGVAGGETIGMMLGTMEIEKGLEVTCGVPVGSAAFIVAGTVAVLIASCVDGLKD